jgi:hypothetical protein
VPKVGFAKLSKEERRKLGRRGGRAAQRTNAHRWDSKEATRAAKASHKRGKRKKKKNAQR